MWQVWSTGTSKQTLEKYKNLHINSLWKSKFWKFWTVADKKIGLQNKIIHVQLSSNIYNCCIIYTLLDWLLPFLLFILMNWFFMNFEINLVCCLVITLIAFVPDTLMSRFLMSFETALCGCLVIAFIAFVLDTPMNWFFMYFETGLYCCLVITFAAFVLDTLMSWFFMCF